MRLYYHKTDGGAEYLCSNNVKGTEEGSLKSKYIVRIDGDIEEDAELLINDEIKEEIPIFKGTKEALDNLRIRFLNK